MNSLIQKSCLLFWFFVFSVGAAVAQTTHYQSGNSMRNQQLGHYYKMVSWDSRPYQEFTYWLSSGTNVVEFMNWRIIFPQGYQQQGSQKYPMILVLHGAGESGREWSGNYAYAPTDPRYDNNDLNLLWGGQEHLNAVNNGSFPGIVVFPQVSYSGAWSTDTWNNGVMNDNGKMVTGIVEYLIANYQADPYRVYVHGLSGGAKGVWDVASKRPDLFAAMLPMSGVGTDVNAMTDVLVTTPIWLFQGGLDTNPSPGYSSQWINALRDKGGNPRYTVYPNLGHGTWNSAYAEPDFFSWMLSQDKRKIYVFSDNTSLENQSSIKLGFSEGYLSYQWMVDGVAIPGATSRYYMASQPGNYTVRFRRKTDGVMADSFPTQITTGGQSQNLYNGLAFNYYEFAGSFPGLTTFDFNQEPTSSGNINNFYLYNKRSNQFALSYDGDLQVDKPGPFRFYARSADGSMIYINGTMVVNNDGAHDARTVSNTYNFPSPGKYPIRVLYFNQSSSKELEVRYNEGTTDNYAIANVIPDGKLSLPGVGNRSARYTSMGFASTSNAKQDSSWSNYYREQIVRDTTKTNVIAYPNPFENKIHLTFLKQVGQLPLGLYDLVTGHLLAQQVVDSSDSEALVEFQGIPSGMYLLKVGTECFKVVKKN